MTERESDGPDSAESSTDYEPSSGAEPDDSAGSDVSAAKTDTSVSDTQPVHESDPGPPIGDTTGEDPQGADDTRA